MIINNVGSGSRGNATLVYDGKTLIQIDAGISLKRIKKALTSFGKGFDDISAILITHSHSDHTKYLSIFDDDKIYGPEVCVNSRNNSLSPSVIYRFNTLEVIPLKLSHDVPCYGYLISSSYTNEKLVYITDTGFISTEVMDLVSNAEFYIIEANHDSNMELNSNRPLYLIRRNMSDKGHLNNIDSAYYLTSFVGNKTRVLMFAHLSEECNTEELVLKAYNEVFLAQTGRVDERIKVLCLKQNEETLIKELVK